jgi:hypothetical protein
LTAAIAHLKDRFFRRRPAKFNEADHEPEFSLIQRLGKSHSIPLSANPSRAWDNLAQTAVLGCSGETQSAHQDFEPPNSRMNPMHFTLICAMGSQ